MSPPYILEIYIERPAAAVAIMSNLVCYCSKATVACIWHIDSLAGGFRREATVHIFTF